MLFPLGNKPKHKAQQLGGMDGPRVMAWPGFVPVDVTFNPSPPPAAPASLRRVEILYMPYLAPWAIVSLRESESVCQKVKIQCKCRSRHYYEQHVPAPLGCPAVALPR